MLFCITSGFFQCSAVPHEQATELSQQLLLLQADTRHHAHAASRCVQAWADDSWHMHPC